MNIEKVDTINAYAGITIIFCIFALFGGLLVNWFGYKPIFVLAVISGVIFVVTSLWGDEK